MVRRRVDHAGVGGRQLGRDAIDLALESPASGSGNRVCERRTAKHGRHNKHDRRVSIPTLVAYVRDR